jgi:hypothetical protein
MKRAVGAGAQICIRAREGDRAGLLNGANQLNAIRKAFPQLLAGAHNPGFDRGFRKLQKSRRLLDFSLLHNQHPDDRASDATQTLN